MKKRLAFISACLNYSRESKLATGRVRGGPPPNVFEVDAVHERLGIVFVVARLINAPDMGDVAKLFGVPGPPIGRTRPVTSFLIRL
jgi:hypothetical protein